MMPESADHARDRRWMRVQVVNPEMARNQFEGAAVMGRALR